MLFQGRTIKVSDKVTIGRTNSFTGVVVGLDEDDDCLIEASAKIGWLGANGEAADIQRFKLNPEKFYLWVVRRQITGHEPMCLCCVECKQHNEWAEPNRRDGSFLCYSCKKDYSWKYPTEEEVAA